jgi:hypothetical protein
MADAKPSKTVEEVAPAISDVVEYIGEGSKKVKFTPDPKAAKTRVYDDGFVVIDY